tara:strand:- start:243 stop:491 length:249 start_codon:yes stop_codon:yes gene_type:complete
MQYRLHIDIPLGTDEEHAIYKSKLLIQEFIGPSYANVNEKYDIEEINYRLGYDEDRQKSNYLDKNENEHVSNKKLRIEFHEK